MGAVADADGPGAPLLRPGEAPPPPTVLIVDDAGPCPPPAIDPSSAFGHGRRRRSGFDQGSRRGKGEGGDQGATYTALLFVVLILVDTAFCILRWRQIAKAFLVWGVLPVAVLAVATFCKKLLKNWYRD